MINPRERRKLTNLQKGLIAFCLSVVVGFGALTLLRSAYLVNRHTDAGVYFRAAAAIVDGNDIYRATDNNGWHYHYPPLLAFVLVPLADPPVARSSGLWPLPYPLSITIWYVANVLAAAFGIHFIARAIERCSPSTRLRDPLPYGQAWWALRFIPLIACLEPLGHSLGRGQVNPLVLLCIGLSCSAFIRNKPNTGGAWLGLATSIKLFPAYLFLYPLSRRQPWPIFAGLAVLVVSVGLLPLALVGPERCFALIRAFFDVVFFQMIGGGESIRTAELADLLNGDLMAFKALGAKLLWAMGIAQPLQYVNLLTVGHVIAALVLTGVTLKFLTASTEGAPDPLEPALALGLLVTAAVPMIPTAQSHYYMLSSVLVIGLLADDWERHDDILPSWSLRVVLGLFMALSVLRELPGFHAATHFGVPVWAGLVLWAYGLRRLKDRRDVRARV